MTLSEKLVPSEYWPVSVLTSVASFVQRLLVSMTGIGSSATEESVVTIVSGWTAYVLRELPEPDVGAT